MITLQELRLGNYVFAFGKGNIQVKSIEANSINGNLTLNILKPIALTPEILKKCGIILGSKIEFVFESDALWRKIIFDGNFNDGIQYLHQLQNLYFALTGKEFEIKNTVPA